jgi:phage terminase large subunit
LNRYCLDTVQSIGFERRDEFFDLHVPEKEHYFAEGFWHHNTGKTYTNLLKILDYGTRYAGARMLILRKTRESLSQTALVTWEDEILGLNHPIIGNPIQRSHREQYLFPNGSRLITAGMDKPAKVLSSSYSLIYVNEATELTAEEWETLGGRLGRSHDRDALTDRYDQLISDCNPTSPHHWLYKRCENGLCKLYETYHWDNPHYYDVERGEWTMAGKRYIGGRLRQMTGTRKERFLLGKWVAASGLVYDYDPKVHLLPPSWMPEKHWKRVWAIDWGKTSPTVCQFWAVDEAGRMYLYREFYKTRLRPDQLAKWVTRELEHGNEPLPTAIVCDHDEERRHDFERASKLSLTLADKTDRDKGIEAMQARFDIQDDGKPRIFFRNGLLGNDPDRELVDAGKPTNAIEEVCGYVWDDKKQDETIQYNDHSCDCFRYATRFVDSNLNPVAALPYKPRPDPFGRLPKNTFS